MMADSLHQAPQGGRGGSSVEGARAWFVPPGLLSPLLLIAVSAFFLAALFYMRFNLPAGTPAEGLWTGLVIQTMRFLGFVPSVMLFVLLLAWSSIWYLTGELDRLAERAQRTGVLVLCLAICVNLDHEVQPPFGGWLGWHLATPLESVFRTTLSILVMAGLTVSSLLLATDGLFYRYFDSSFATGGKAASPVPRSQPLAAPGDGVEDETADVFRSIADAFEPAAPATARNAAEAGDSFRVVGRAVGDDHGDRPGVDEDSHFSVSVPLADTPAVEEEPGGWRARREARRRGEADAEGVVEEYEADLRSASNEAGPDLDEIELSDLLAATADIGSEVVERSLADGTDEEDRDDEFGDSDRDDDVGVVDAEDDDDELMRAARAAAEDARSVLRAQSRKVFSGEEFFAGENPPAEVEEERFGAGLEPSEVAPPVEGDAAGPDDESFTDEDEGEDEDGVEFDGEDSDVLDPDEVTQQSEAEASLGSDDEEPEEAGDGPDADELVITDFEPAEPTVTIARPPAPTPGHQGHLFGPGALDPALIEEAAELVLTSHRASAEFLRRRLRVDRNEARELLARLHELGVVVCDEGADHGEVIMDIEDWRSRSSS